MQLLASLHAYPSITAAPAAPVAAEEPGMYADADRLQKREKRRLLTINHSNAAVGLVLNTFLITAAPAAPAVAEPEAPIADEKPTPVAPVAPAPVTTPAPATTPKQPTPPATTTTTPSGSTTAPKKKKTLKQIFGISGI